MCPFCKLRFQKLKYHIKNVHKLSSGEAQRALDTEKTQFKNSLESFLDTFQKEYLETRLGGTSFDTSNSATQQIKAERNRASLLLSWLSEKCEQSSFNLDTCIQATAKLSNYLDEKKKELSPKTLFSHMTTFKKNSNFFWILIMEKDFPNKTIWEILKKWLFSFKIL